MVSNMKAEVCHKIILTVIHQFLQNTYEDQIAD